MNTCDVCGKEVNSIYIAMEGEEFVSGHKHCVRSYSFGTKPSVTVPLNPFADEEEIDRLEGERNQLIDDLETFPINQDEKRFLVRKIRNITNKLIEKARYLKKK